MPINYFINNFLPKKEEKLVEPGIQDSSISSDEKYYCNYTIETVKKQEEDKMEVNQKNEDSKVVMNPNDILEDKEFSKIFPRNPRTVVDIKELMKNGYDPSQPIVCWKTEEKVICVDGHTRRQAAIELDLKEVWVNFKDFKDREDARKYCVDRQMARRNLSDWDIVVAAHALENKTTRDGTGSSAKKLAELLQTCESNINRAKSIYLKMTDEEKKLMEEGKLTINQVYQKHRKKKQLDDDNNKINEKSVDKIHQSNEGIDQKLVMEIITYLFDKDEADATFLLLSKYKQLLPKNFKDRYKRA